MSYNNDIDTDLLKSKLLQTFSFTIDFLNRHNLRWFVGGGTCIGAVRHGGLIPWDDDIDIFMPREDYNILLSICYKLEGTGYRLTSWSTNKSMIPFAKIIDSSTTLWEIKYHPYISGIFVDIFPMDYTGKCEREILSDLKKYNRLLIKYQAAMSEYSVADLLRLAKSGRIHFLREGILSFLTHRRKSKYFKKMQLIESENNSLSGDYCVLFSACFAYRFEKEIFRREWFEEYIIKPFENLNVRVPKGYDAYLRHVYGDYMQLPPIEKRVTRHYHYYINLLESKSIDQIRTLKNCEGKCTDGFH